MFESVFWLRLLLDLPECASDENAVDDDCLPHPDRSVVAAGKSAAKNWVQTQGWWPMSFVKEKSRAK
jgi:hypothetical protein